MLAKFSNIEKYDKCRIWSNISCVIPVVHKIIFKEEKKDWGDTFQDVINGYLWKLQIVYQAI